MNPTYTNPYVASVMADSPLAYWRLDELSGSFVDSVSTYTAAITGTPSYRQAGPFGNFGVNCLSTANYGLVPLFLVYPFSIELWIKPLISSDARIAQWEDTAGYGHGIRAVWSSGSSGLALVAFSSDVGGGVTGGSISAFVSMSEWSHVVGVWTSASDRVVYTDGIAAAVNTQTRSPTPTQFKIGGGGNVTSEVAIYPHALSAERIQLHYELGLARLNGSPTIQKPQRCYVG